MRARAWGGGGADRIVATRFVTPMQFVTRMTSRAALSHICVTQEILTKCIATNCAIFVELKEQCM